MLRMVNLKMFNKENESGAVTGGIHGSMSLNTRKLIYQSNHVDGRSDHARSHASCLIFSPCRNASDYQRSPQHYSGNCHDHGRIVLWPHNCGLNYPCSRNYIGRNRLSSGRQPVSSKSSLLNELKSE